MASDSERCKHERWNNDAGLNVYCLDCGLPMGCDIVNACVSSKCSPLLSPIGEPWSPCADCIATAAVAAAQARKIGIDGYAWAGERWMLEAKAFQKVPVRSSQELVRVTATEREDSASAQPTCVQAAQADGAIDPAYFAAAHNGLESKRETPVQKIEIAVTRQDDPRRVAKLLQAELRKRGGQYSEHKLSVDFSEGNKRFAEAKERLEAHEMATAKGLCAVICEMLAVESPVDLTPEWFARYNGVRK